MCSSALASARSVPGSGCRCRSAWPGGRGEPGVDDDQRAAALPLLGRGSAASGGMVSAGLAPDQQQGVGRAEVGQRERQPPVDAEGPDAGGRRRGHAEPAVVVDVAGAQRDPGELAQRVRLLVGQPAAAEDADRVPAVPSAWTARDAGRRSGPAPRPSSPGAVRRSPGRAPAGVVSRSGWSEQFGGGPALLAERRPGWWGTAGGAPDTAGVGRSRSVIPHCSAQYGQWVATSRDAGPGALPTVHRLSCRESVPPGGFRSGSLLFRSCQVRLTPHGGSGPAPRLRIWENNPIFWEAGMSVTDVFDAVAGTYDEAAAAVPCFDAFYGTAVEVRRQLRAALAAGRTPRCWIWAGHRAARPASRRSGAGGPADPGRRGAGDARPRHRPVDAPGACRTRTVRADLADELPPGRYDAVVTALAIHHLADAGKRALYRRAAAALGPGRGVRQRRAGGRPDAGAGPAVRRGVDAADHRAGFGIAGEIAAARGRMRHDRPATVADQCGGSPRRGWSTSTVTSRSGASRSSAGGRPDYNAGIMLVGAGLADAARRSGSRCSRSTSRACCT